MSFNDLAQDVMTLSQINDALKEIIILISNEMEGDHSSQYLDGLGRAVTIINKYNHDIAQEMETMAAAMEQEYEI